MATLPLEIIVLIGTVDIRTWSQMLAIPDFARWTKTKHANLCASRFIVRTTIGNRTEFRLNGRLHNFNDMPAVLIDTPRKPQEWQWFKNGKRWRDLRLPNIVKGAHCSWCQDRSGICCSRSQDSKSLNFGNKMDQKFRRMYFGNVILSDRFMTVSCRKHGVFYTTRDALEEGIGCIECDKIDFIRRAIRFFNKKGTSYEVNKSRGTVKSETEIFTFDDSLYVKTGAYGQILQL